MGGFLAEIYPWVTAVHVMSVIAWMAGLFYLPRLFVYHAERSEPGDDLDRLFQVMEYRLLRFIMNPAMAMAWLFGLLLVFTPGIIDWTMVWPWSKSLAVLGMTLFHHWLARRRKDFAAGQNTVPGRKYRMMNEVPTLLMIVIVASVIVKF